MNTDDMKVNSIYGKRHHRNNGAKLSSCNKILHSLFVIRIVAGIVVRITTLIINTTILVILVILVLILIIAVLVIILK